MSYEFDDRWLDVDFEKEAPKAGRVMGLSERPESKFGAIPFKSRFSKIPRSEWSGLIEKRNAEGVSCRKLVVAICDQNGEPSCTSNATVQSHQIRQAAQFGKEKVVRLSPISVYRHVGSPRSGSSVDDNLEFLREHGALPLDDEANRSRGIQGLHPHNGYGVREPSNSDQFRLRCDEWVLAEDFEEFVSLSLMGYAMVYGRQGHCICNVDVQESRGRLVFPYANSWHESWGDEGFGIDSEGQIRMGAGWAFGCASVLPHPCQLEP